MNKQEIYALLKERGIWHEITEHGAVYNMDDLAAVELPYPDADAKNLFVRDDKKRCYYLITVKGDKRVDLKEFAAKNGTRKLSFASSDDLLAFLGLTPGAVTPLGLLNDGECRVIFYLDSEFSRGSGIIGVHPNENTATVWLKTEALIELLRESGHEINCFEA